MSGRPEGIARIVETVERYNTTHIATLETYVWQQVSGENELDCEANLALLKLHAARGGLIGSGGGGGGDADAVPASVVAVFVVALAALPAAALNAARCLLPPHAAALADRHVAAILRLQRLLETCDFSAFWSLLATVNIPSNDNADHAPVPLITVFPQFQKRIRLFIANTLKVSYQQIDAALFLKYLNFTDLNDPDAKYFISLLGCSINL
ncbi:Eukaryotic translation initiation factor 3 subunit K, partial [Physocladia obscura]